MNYWYYVHQRPAPAGGWVMGFSIMHQTGGAEFLIDEAYKTVPDAVIVFWQKISKERAEALEEIIKSSGRVWEEKIL